MAKRRKDPSDKNSVPTRANSKMDSEEQEFWNLGDAGEADGLEDSDDSEDSDPDSSIAGDDAPDDSDDIDDSGMNEDEDDPDGDEEDLEWVATWDSEVVAACPKGELSVHDAGTLLLLEA